MDEGRLPMGGLPGEAWFLVAKALHPFDRFAFTSACKAFLELVKFKLEVEVDINRIGPVRTLSTVLTESKMSKSTPCFTLDWFKWVFESFERRGPDRPKPGTKDYADELRHPDKAYFYDSDLVYVAAFVGDTQVLEWLVSKGMKIDSKDWRCGTAAAQSGHLEALKWMVSQGFKFDFMTLCHAACGGHIHVMEWLRDQGCPWNSRVTNFASCGGQLDALKWLVTQDPPCPVNGGSVYLAMLKGHLHILKFLYTIIPDAIMGAGSSLHALERRSVRILRWLHSKGIKIDNRVLCSATRRGDLATLKWLIDKERVSTQTSRRDLEPVMFAQAAAGGFMHIITYLKSKGFKWNERVCLIAANNGQLRILQWLRKQDPPCPWKKNECVLTARNHEHVRDWISQQPN